MLWLLQILVLQSVFAGEKAHSLRISSIEVPPAVKNSSQVTLVCKHDLQGDQLYSVKWYKNYVEFYRYQPNEVAGITSTTGEIETNSKHEFELDGINLNLSKSNETHVYLRQTSLASEGTYKCEVSLDLPSFATVSIERQMKVYALPKQKLTIINNSLDSGQQAKSPSVYAINDLINLTCISTASKPAAKLSWFLNDMPVVSVSKWLPQAQLHHSSRSILLNQNQELIESRLTVTFRIQPSHLLANETNQVARNLQHLKLRCLSKLSVEFSSETSIIVGGGNEPLNYEQQPLPMPTPLSLHLSGEVSAAEPPLYRWPRPIKRRNNQTDVDLEPIEQSNSDLDEFSSDQSRAKSQQNSDMIWTNRQFVMQSEHIEQVMRWSRPNEFEAPTIETEAPQNEQSGREPSRVKMSRADEDWLAAETVFDQPNMDSGIISTVQFVCRPRVAAQQTVETLKSVYSKWFINNEEIQFDQINAFNGTNFYFRRQDNGSIPSKRSSSTKTSNLQTTDSEVYQQTRLTKHKLQLEDGSRSISIQFTPSLLQLKEIQLRCTTLIEQPLIEYESQFVVLVPSNQIMQINPQIHRHKSFGSTLKGQKHIYVNSNSLKQRQKVRNSSKSLYLSIRSSIIHLDYFLLCLISWLIIRFRGL